MHLPEMRKNGYHYGYAPREFNQAEVAEAKKLLAEDRYDEAWKLLVSEGANGNSYAYAFLGDCLCSGKYWVHIPSYESGSTAVIEQLHRAS